RWRAGTGRSSGSRWPRRRRERAGLPSDGLRRAPVSHSLRPPQRHEKGSSMPDLIPPHGGLAEPVSLTVPATEAERFRTEAARLARVPVSDSDLSSVYRFGDGGLSPLTGPMDEATYHRVLD